MSYDDIIYIILFILLIILVERVFLNDINFTDLKTKMINGIKNSINNGNGNGNTSEDMIKEGFDDKPFKHRGGGSLADNKKKDKTGSYELSEGDERMIKTVQVTYDVADKFAYMMIKMPYDLLNKIRERLFDFLENMKDILQPIVNFGKQMFNIAKRVFMQFYNMWLKYVKQFFAIMRNLPDFIRRNADLIIDFVSNFIMSIITSLESFASMFEKILSIIVELPSMVFKLLNQIPELLLNIIIMVLRLPSFLIGIVISLQNQGLSLMDKSFGIPFMDLFFN
jgi:hypothetical protein